MAVTPSAKWNTRYALVSLMIVLVLALQVSVTLRLYRGAGYLPVLSVLRLLAAPQAFPFITYPMYSEPHFEGDKIARYRLLGLLQEGTEVPLTAEDLNIHFWLFYGGVVPAVRAGDKERVARYVSVFERETGNIVTGVRLENQPLILQKSGASEGASEVVATVRLRNAE